MTKTSVMKASHSAILADCLQVVHQLFYFLDEADYLPLVQLFTPDGCWDRQGELLTGRDMVAQALAKRPVTQHIRHVISNGFLAKVDDVAVQFVAYMTAYRFDNGTHQQSPVTIHRPFRLSVMRAALASSDAGWRISDLRLTPEFEFTADSPQASRS